MLLQFRFRLSQNLLMLIYIFDSLFISLNILMMICNTSIRGANHLSGKRTIFLQKQKDFSGIS